MLSVFESLRDCFSYDRGHLAPAADFRFDRQTMLESLLRMYYTDFGLEVQSRKC